MNHLAVHLKHCKSTILQKYIYSEKRNKLNIAQMDLSTKQKQAQTENRLVVAKWARGRMTRDRVGVWGQ